MSKKISHRERRGKQRNNPNNSTLDDVSISKGRSVSISSNKIKYVIAKEGDTFESLAKELEIMPWQIWKYNDLNKNSVLKEGQKLYIQPKRRSAKTDWHLVKEGETMLFISQKYGVKLKSLYKKNRMEMGQQPTAGQKISLRKTID